MVEKNPAKIAANSLLRKQKRTALSLDDLMHIAEGQGFSVIEYTELVVKTAQSLQSV